MRCRHRWTVVGRSYTRPNSISVEEVSGAQALELVERLSAGRTTVSLRCEQCGDVAARQVIGQWTDATTDS